VKKKVVLVGYWYARRKTVFTVSKTKHKNQTPYGERVKRSSIKDRRRGSIEGELIDQKKRKTEKVEQVSKREKGTNKTEKVTESRKKGRGGKKPILLARARAKPGSLELWGRRVSWGNFGGGGGG